MVFNNENAMLASSNADSDGVVPGEQDTPGTPQNIQSNSSRKRDISFGTKKSLALTAEQQEDLLGNVAVLRVEQVGSIEGKVLEILFWCLMAIFFAYGIASIVLATTDTTQPKESDATGIPQAYFVGNLAALSTLLGILLFCMSFFGYRLANIWRHKKYYKARQKFMMIDARVIGMLTMVDLTMIVASYGLFVAADCLPNGTVLTAFALIRSLIFIAVLAWMTITARLMRVYSNIKNESFLDRLTSFSSIMTKQENEDPTDPHTDVEKNMRQDPDRILLIDQPLSVIVKDQMVFLIIYGVYMVVIVIAVIFRISQASPDSPSLPPKDIYACPVQYQEMVAETGINCSPTTADIISYVVMAVAIFAYVLLYLLGVRHSWASQKNLPNSHFRLSKLFLRIQMRYGRLLFFAIVFTGVIVDLASIGTCRGRINSVLGSPSSHLALGVYACTVLLLFAPAKANDSYNRMIFKTIAWTDDDIEERKKERREMIEKMQGEESMIGKMSTAPAKFIAKQIGAPDSLGLFKKPMEAVICMEYLCKTFLWSRAAYRRIDLGLPEYVPEDKKDLFPFGEKSILSVFGMNLLKHFYEPKMDTYCMMGSGNNTLVISFRGTASGANILTDLKAWSTSYPPHPYLTSRDTFGEDPSSGFQSIGSKVFRLPVRVHKGFYEAWTSDGFNTQVIEAAVAEIGKMKDADVFITGHSLGGALACLAAVELKIALPSNNKVHVYTYGAPRVGNMHFGTFANALIPDYWHIVGTEDPVARIPKGSYKRSGHRVLLGCNGNLEIYPSHFEASLFSNIGGKVSDHMLNTYGKRIGQFLKAQFVPSLSLAGASKGVIRLSRKINLEKTTCVGPMNGGHLSDQNLDLTPIEYANPPPKKQQKGNGDLKNDAPCGCVFCLGKKSQLKVEGDLDEDVYTDAHSEDQEPPQTFGDRVEGLFSSIVE
jgi:hypothetical protein